MGTKFWEVVCDEHRIGGSGESCSDNDSHLGRINVLYHEALGGKNVPRAVFFDFEPGVVGPVTLSHRSANSSARTALRTIRAGKNMAKGHCKRAEHQRASDSTPSSVAACVSNSEPHIGARLLLHVCVGPELARSFHFLNVDGIIRYFL